MNFTFSFFASIMKENIGALIEELDIYDLKELLSKTDNDDIKIVYLNLLKGSRNHLRSFDRQLDRNGFSYEVKFLSQKEYDSIASSAQERGGTIKKPDRGRSSGRFLFFIISIC